VERLERAKSRVWMRRDWGAWCINMRRKCNAMYGFLCMGCEMKMLAVGKRSRAHAHRCPPCPLKPGLGGGGGNDDTVLSSNCEYSLMPETADIALTRDLGPTPSPLFPLALTADPLTLDPLKLKDDGGAG